MEDNMEGNGNGKDILPAVKNSALPGPLTGHQKLSIARMLVYGHGPKTIANVVRKTAGYISTLTHPVTGDPEILELVEQCEAKYLRTQAGIKFELMEYVDQAKSAIHDGLDPATDIRTRLDTAWKILKEIQPSAQEVNVHHDGKVSMEANLEVAGNLKAIAVHLSGLPQLPGAFQARLREGDDALPGPAMLPEGDIEVPVVEHMEPLTFEEPDA
jgi:hypothetical protein